MKEVDSAKENPLIPEKLGSHTLLGLADNVSWLDTADLGFNMLIADILTILRSLYLPIYMKKGNTCLYRQRLFKAINLLHLHEVGHICHKIGPR